MGEHLPLKHFTYLAPRSVAVLAAGLEQDNKTGPDFFLPSFHETAR